MIYTKPARHSHKQTSMDVLMEVPEHILDQVHAHYQQVFAEELVSALNCCRKYKCGWLTITTDNDNQRCVAIKLHGEARVFRALQALNKWMDVEDAFSLLGSMSGLPVLCSAIQYVEANTESGPF